MSENAFRPKAEAHKCAGVRFAMTSFSTTNQMSCCIFGFCIRSPTAILTQESETRGWCWSSISHWYMIHVTSLATLWHLKQKVRLTWLCMAVGWGGWGHLGHVCPHTPDKNPLFESIKKFIWICGRFISRLCLKLLRNTVLDTIFLKTFQSTAGVAVLHIIPLKTGEFRSNFCNF